MNSKIILRIRIVEIDKEITNLWAVDPWNDLRRAEIRLARAALEEEEVDYTAWATVTLSDGKRLDLSGVRWVRR